VLDLPLPLIASKSRSTTRCAIASQTIRAVVAEIRELLLQADMGLPLPLIASKSRSATRCTIASQTIRPMVAEIRELLLQADMDLPLQRLQVEIHEMRGDCEPDRARA
jgi:hypothetical protein